MALAAQRREAAEALAAQGAVHDHALRAAVDAEAQRLQDAVDHANENLATQQAEVRRGEAPPSLARSLPNRPLPLVHSLPTPRCWRRSSSVRPRRRRQRSPRPGPQRERSARPRWRRRRRRTRVQWR